MNAEVLATNSYRPPRHYYPLLPSTRPAIACVQLQLGQGNDLGELTYALKLLKRRLARGGYLYDIKRGALAKRIDRRKLKSAGARRRRRKTASVRSSAKRRGKGDDRAGAYEGKFEP